MKPYIRHKTYVFLFISLTILFALSLCGTAARATAKPSLSHKTVKLTAGKTKTIKVRHATRKVKWSTTNKKIARIKKKSGKKNQKVVIQAGQQAGKCYIKARIGKKTLKCKVVVRKKSAGTTTTETGKTPATETTGESTTEENPANDLEADSFEYVYSDFSFKILQKTIEADRAAGKEGNVLLSPDSIATALAMTKNGAAGKTLEEMEAVLSPGMEEEAYNQALSETNKRLSGSEELIYQVSNSIWAREGMVDVREDFLQKNQDYYDADFHTASFDDQTIQDMNDWVYEKTRHMIDKIIQELSKDARMVLINTVAFEGQWQEPFEISVQETFHSSTGEEEKASMLKDTEYYPYMELKGGKGFVKYYGKDGKRGEVAFVGLLPPEGMDADTYIQSLTGKDFINSWNQKKSKNIRLSLPEFSYDYGTELGGILQDMGMPTAFTDDADFSRMSNPTPDTPALKISKVLHKTHIELDKNGTKAAAATAVVMEKCTAIMGDEPIELTFDRPFVYALVDTSTGIPLFIGEVTSISK